MRAFHGYPVVVATNILRREPKHVEWVRSLNSLLDKTRAYVMEHHTTGLVWNPKVGDLWLPVALHGSSLMKHSGCFSFRVPGKRKRKGRLRWRRTASTPSPTTTCSRSYRLRRRSRRRGRSVCRAEQGRGRHERPSQGRQERDDPQEPKFASEQRKPCSLLSR